MRAKRSLGQNFLIDPNLQRKVVEALEPEPADTVIEIGPGHGALTDHLTGHVARVVAVELDDDLAAELARRYAGRPDVEVVHRDVLAWDPRATLEAAAAHEAAGAAGAARVKVVGNIPYNITSPIIFRLLEWRPVPSRIILMVQKEVADRLVAPAGDRQYGALSVGVQAVAQVRRLFNVGRGAFRPVPNVDSAVVRIEPLAPMDEGAAERLRTLTRTVFGLRRKQLQKILRTAGAYGLMAEEADAVIREVGLQPRDRPEVLSPEQFIRLAAALDRRGYPAHDGDTAPHG